MEMDKWVGSDTVLVCLIEIKILGGYDKIML